MSDSYPLSLAWDHPRSRGVYRRYSALDMGRMGSSPLARGLRPRPARAPRSQGIIPARAGFTPQYDPDILSCEDHPRSRGVYGPVAQVTDAPEGSSPLARGLLTIAVAVARCGRIIPARAGFTGSAMRKYTLTQGSSPLARGLRRPGAHRRPHRRIIPARAGFTVVIHGAG